VRGKTPIELESELKQVSAMIKKMEANSSQMHSLKTTYKNLLIEKSELEKLLKVKNKN
jgi:hypothetical protein